MTTIKISLKQDNGSFLEHDILGIMSEIGLYDVPVINIYTYEGTKQEKISNIKRLLECIDLNKCVVITTAYVSTTEFPPEKYESIKNIPVDEVLNDGIDTLQRLGFININDYVDYEYKVAFIFGNKYGLEIREYISKLLSNKED